MTNWENIVSGKELITAKNKRKNLYIEARERKVALEELEEEGSKIMLIQNSLRSEKKNRSMNASKIKFGFYSSKWVLSF